LTKNALGYILGDFSKTHLVTLANIKTVRAFMALRLLALMRLQQGCQMVCFQTKNPNLG
jgi:hypothetical protein